MMPTDLMLAALPAWLENFTSKPLTLFFYGLGLLVLFGWYFATEDERRKRNVGTTLLVLIGLLCTIALVPLDKKLKGAIDIVGGSSFTMQVQPGLDDNGKPIPVTEADTDQAIVVMEKRLNGTGVAEPVIFRQGVDRFVVQMPGIKPEDVNKIKEILEKAAKLELREVHPMSDTLAEQVSKGEHIEPGYSVFVHKYKIEEGTPDEKEISSNILLNRRPAIVGSDILHAYPDVMGGGRVDITLKSAGEDKMIALTSPMRLGADRIAIVLDGECISAPVVQAVLGKNFQITGLNAEGEAVQLAENLRNPLKNSCKIDEERTVSPTLGAAVVKQGIMSGIVGLAATFLFILVYYRFAGLVALVGLVVNTVMLFGIMAMFGFSFSLPGIAGIVLTIGMAVDANVLIYERLREELAAGKSIKNAIAIAYEKAFTAIFDSNFTSLITAVILFWRASGTVKGFAITLTIGLVASLFASILVTRVLFRWAVDYNVIKKFTFLDLIKGANYDFLSKRAACAVVSFILIAASIGVGFVKKDGALGIDFTGGTIITYTLGDKQIMPVKDVEKVVNSLSLKKAAVTQEEKNLVTGRLLTIRCESEDAAKIEEQIAATFPEVKTQTELAPSREGVSALLGKEFLVDSGLALLMGMVLIFLYVAFRYRLSFAVGAIIALFHDVIISCGLVVLMGNQLSLIHIGAILTIAGYSINDTVIIFDRIRESLRYSTGSLKDIMNEAINATLSRTVLTSGATLFSVGALYFFGGPAMRDFSLMILIGIVVGTYSSIFVASALVLWWAKITRADYREVEETPAENVEVVG